MKKIKHEYNVFTAILITISVFFIGLFIANIIAGDNKIFTNFIFWLIVPIILIPIYRKEILSNIKTLKNDFKNNISDILKYVFIFFFCQIVWNIILNLVLKNTPDNQEKVLESFKQAPIIMMIGMGIIGPIQEELLFRLPFSRVKMNKIILFIIYSLLFALVHLMAEETLIGALLSFPTYLFLSFMIGYPFYKTNNILLSISIHIINNMLSLLPILLSMGVIL